MKRWIAFLLASCMMFAFAACGKEAKNPVVADVMAEIRRGIEFPEMAEKSLEDLPGYGYDSLDSASVEEMSYIIAGSGLTAEEVFIVKCKEGTDMESIQSMMTARRDQIAQDAIDYTPSESEKVTTAVIGTAGNYAYFAITGDNAKAKEIFDASF